VLKTITQARQVSGTNGDLAHDARTQLSGRLANRTAQITVVGLGYAGLPMAVEFARAGYSVTGLDINEKRVRAISEGRSPVSDVADSDVRALAAAGKLQATTDPGRLAQADVVFICVPTPLTADQEPDLSFVRSAARSIAASLHPGMLVVLQSTCPPWTTRRVLLPILQQAQPGLRVGDDYFVAFAPERIDPGNKRYNVHNTPKIVGGITAVCSQLGVQLFTPISQEVIQVSSPEVAETTKLLENSFRFVNISFINEMIQVCDRLGVNIWEVVNAAATKPFGFLAHYPGPGVGGDCIPIVPFHLEAAAREHGASSEMIKAAGRINSAMPAFVVEKLTRLVEQRGREIKGARVLVLGVAYKADVDDVRESPSLHVIEILRTQGADVAYYDPHAASVRLHGVTLNSITWDELVGQHFDCGVLLTPHSGVDYAAIARQVDVLLDTRSALNGHTGSNVVCL
jgi:UDP-N-acetyl-D-glucosamine dehydrogenase